jgi:uncharacterized protein YacL (UPF0231 family)
MQLQFYSDADGVPRALCEGPGRVLAGFLESDLQDSLAAAHEVLRAVDEVASGRSASWERTGNAYTLSLSELRDVVADWISFLENGRRS